MPIGGNDQVYRVGARLFATGGGVVVREFGRVGDAGDKQFGRAQRRADALARSIGNLARQARYAIPAFGAAALALAAFGRHSIDASAKLAVSLASTTEGVQTMERAADLAGVTFEQLRTGVLQLTRNLSQAAAGFGPVVTLIDQIHGNAEELLALPIDERVAAVQSAIAKYVPEAQQAALASRFFGEEAGLMFARIDPSVLRQARADLELFGATTGEIAATQVQRANDALSRLAIVWQGITRTVASETAPAMKRLADQLTRLAVNTRLVERLGRLFAAAANAVARATELVVDNLDRLAFYSLSVATIMAARLIPTVYALVASFVALDTAGLFVLRLSRALLFIGAALGIGELLKALNDLRVSLGGLGEVWALVRSVIQEQWTRTIRYIQLAWFRWLTLYSRGVATMIGAIERWSQAVVDVSVRGVSGSLRAWYGLGAGLSRIWALIVRSFADVVIGGISRRWDALVESMQSVFEALGLEVNTTGANLFDRFQETLTEAAVAAEIAALRLEQAGVDAAESLANRLEEALAVDLGTDALRDTVAVYERAAAQIAATLEAPNQSWRRLLRLLREARAAARDTERIRLDTDALPDPQQDIGQPPGEDVLQGWRRAQQIVQEYVNTARDWGAQVGNAITGALGRAEDAFVKFAQEGKLSFRDLADSIIGDLIRIAYRQAILAPIGGALGNVLGGLGIGQQQHHGGIVGQDGLPRLVPVEAFAGAARYHGGGFPGLRPDEVPVIAQRGERILNRREAAGYGADGARQVTVNIDARGAQQGVAEQIDARLRQALPGLARAVRADVATPRRRGERI